jgi:hypothetical protein
MKNDAQSMVDQLTASASKSKPKSRNKRNAKDGKPEDKAHDNKDKKRRGKFDADEQIRKLNESMERQISKSSKLMRDRAQSRIDQLSKDGKDESSAAVKKVREKLETDLKANELKIRTRINERIKRIRKEKAARDRS